MADKNSTSEYIESETTEINGGRIEKRACYVLQGLDMKAIQYLAGHVEGSEITGKVYIDVSEEFVFEQLKKAS